MTGMPTRIGRYTVARELGSGGMGEVFLAYSPGGDPVAVKLIRSDRLDPVTRERFEKEALIARTVVGTNRVARFLDADPYADRPWLAMEYVPGRTLLECVDADGVLPAPLVASLGALLAEGLGAVHAAGLLHRDLKPANIIMGESGPIVIDFGLAAFTDPAHGSLSRSGTIVGTVRCMPPEQASGNPQVTSAADVYALGTVLLYAATGHYPYDGLRWEAIVAQVTNPAQAPDLSGAPGTLLPLVTSMLAHEAAERPTLDAVTEALTALMAQVKLAPVDARRGLIARTSSGRVSGDGLEPLSPSFEEQLWAQDAAIADQPLDSPLDMPPGALGPTADVPGGDEPAAMEPEPPAEEPAAASGGAAPRRRPRVPASQRIADELRAAYALQSAL
jgi:serine/threonine protein kinase